MNKMYEVISLFARIVPKIIVQFCMIAANSGLEDQVCCAELILETSEILLKLFLGQINLETQSAMQDSFSIHSCILFLDI